ncbi:MAG: hypothetical protein K0S82_12 [Gaiellaceae bacterium]|jgi:hypothetical protein|nr:hypothetical protein [Gaiellaceae bacterium]
MRFIDKVLGVSEPPPEGKTIAQLPVATSLRPDDVIPVMQGGVTKQITVAQLREAMRE